MVSMGKSHCGMQRVRCTYLRGETVRLYLLEAGQSPQRTGLYGKERQHWEVWQKWVLSHKTSNNIYCCDDDDDDD